MCAGEHSELVFVQGQPLVAFLPRASAFSARVGTCATPPGWGPQPASCCGPGVFLLGQGEHVKVHVLAHPARDIAAVCNDKIPLCLGGWDFALGRELSRVAIMLPPSPSAPEPCCVMEMKSRAVLTSGLVCDTCGYQAGGLDTLESC